jgi:hypothetical protein
MILDYNNTGKAKDRYSEARYEGTIPGETGVPPGVDWTTGGSKILSISYKGLADNNADPCLDRMFVLIRDESGNQGPVVYNPDSNAQRKTTWQKWDIPLSGPNSLSHPGSPADVNLKKVSYLWVGLGLRCNKRTGGIPGGGLGEVTFDNIRLERCELSANFNCDDIVNFYDFAVFAREWPHCGKADLYPDCTVDIMDLAVLAEEWLKEEP